MEVIVVLISKLWVEIYNTTWYSTPQLRLRGEKLHLLKGIVIL